MSPPSYLYHIYVPFCMVGALRIELRPRGPKPPALPLRHAPIMQIKQHLVDFH